MEDNSIEEILRFEEKTNARKTVVCDEAYVNLTAKNIKNEEKLEEITNRIEEIQRLSPEKEGKKGENRRNSTDSNRKTISKTQKLTKDFRR